MSEQVPRILVVDDTPANIRLLDAVLTPRGFEVVGVASGAEALTVVGSGDLDVVLLDVQMPGMNGYEVCRRIRELPRRAALPVVMVTASLGEERALALEAGADDFVVRPFDQAELVARVRSLVRIKQYHDRLEQQAGELAELNRSLGERVEAQVDELERLRRLRRFLSPHLADVLLQDDALLRPHRGEIAVVHCELRGFDAVSISSEPEEAVEALTGFHDVLGRLVAAHEATVGYFAGESVMLFFNDPLPVDDPVGSAVRFAAELRADVDAWAEPWRRRGRTLDIASAVTVGYATLGTIGFEGRYDYSAVGTVVNQAARLCEAAGDGEVLLSQRAYAAVADHVVAEPDDDVVLRDGLTLASWRLADAHVLAAGGTGPLPAFRVLGPLEVSGVELTAAKERAVLCLLLLRPRQVVAAEQLADELWEGDPPDSALSTLRAHVSRLRKALATGGLGDALATRPTGYVLDVPDEAVDARCFERLVDEARATAGSDPAQAHELFERALSLWRGAPLTDITGNAAAAAEVARLEECRLATLEDAVAAQLAAGRHREALTELDALTLQHPLRERLWAHRMVALYRSGRQAEALRVFQDLRTLLADELGLDPSPELVELEQAILRRDPVLT